MKIICVDKVGLIKIVINTSASNFQPTAEQKALKMITVEDTLEVKSGDNWDGEKIITKLVEVTPVEVVKDPFLAMQSKIDQLTQQVADLQAAQSLKIASVVIK